MVSYLVTWLDSLNINIQKIKLIKKSNTFAFSRFFNQGDHIMWLLWCLFLVNELLDSNLQALALSFNLFDQNSLRNREIMWVWKFELCSLFANKNRHLSHRYGHISSHNSQWLLLIEEQLSVFSERYNNVNTNDKNVQTVLNPLLHRYSFLKSLQKPRTKLKFILNHVHLYTKKMQGITIQCKKKLYINMQLILKIKRPP